MMITSKTLTTPFTQLTYLIPAGSSDVHSEKDVTALHVLEHWLLEGGKRFVGSDAVFKEARRIGGNISAAVSRKSFELKLTYYAPLHEDAVALMNDLILHARFDAADFSRQLEDVRYEIKNDNAITLLFDALYRDVFNGRYALSGGGDQLSTYQLTESDVTPFIKTFLQAPGTWFYAGPDQFKPLIDEVSANNSKQMLISPTLNFSSKKARYFEQGSIGLVYLGDDFPEDACFEIEAYLDWIYGYQIKVHRHVLPGFIMVAVSYDVPQLAHQEILSSAHEFVQLSEDAKRPFRVLAAASLTDDYSFASGAARLEGERWMNAEFDEIVKKSLSSTI